MSLTIQIFHSWKKNTIFLFFLRFCNGQQFINVQNCNLIIKLIKRQSCHHIETTHLTCSENLLTGFYMMTTLAFNELRHYELSIKWYEKLVFKHLIFNGCMSAHQSSQGLFQNLLTSSYQVIISPFVPNVEKGHKKSALGKNGLKRSSL